MGTFAAWSENHQQSISYNGWDNCFVMKRAGYDVFDCFDSF